MKRDIDKQCDEIIKTYFSARRHQTFTFIIGNLAAELMLVGVREKLTKNR